ncbi:MAG: hypothetical protein RLZZ382_1815, partial [Bacteroidota bacterium]
RFKLGSDGGTVADGYYFDDFEILYNLNAPPVVPIAAFSATSNVICAGQSISFSDGSSNSPSSWNWNFGDGGTATNQNPSHLFSQAGIYAVQLTASNAAGTSTFIDTIIVNPSPSVILTSSDNDNLVCLNDGVVTLSATPGNAIVSGTGVVNNTFNPTSAGVGSFLVTASVLDANGCEGTDTLTITVQQCAGIIMNQQELLKVIPNPFSESFQIEGLQNEDIITVFDLNGNVIIESFNNSNINSQKLAKGTYILLVERMNSREFIRVVKI